MATKGGLNIVTDGLVLALDAANPKSYPGSGTAWNDLVNSNNLTLTNGAVYIPQQNGGISFDGVNDYAATTNFGLSTNFTYEGYFYISTTDSGYSGFFGSMNSPSGYSGVGSGFVARISNTGEFQMYAKNNGVGNDGDYIFNREGNFRSEYAGQNIHMVYTYNNGSHVLYLNGELFLQNSTGPTIGSVDPSSANSTLYVGAYTWGITSQTYYLKGRNYNFKVYNRTLSQTEAQQNYNATKQRFK